ncbi:MAG: DUF502 domain-containing protein [Thermotogae bacterium]|nr:DUF502 domain-containing protein [Thermotogota bacterium]
MNEGERRWLRFRQRFLAGVVVLAPLFVTVWVVFFLINFIAGWLARPLSHVLSPIPYPVLLIPSLLILAIIIYIVGWFATTYLGGVIFNFLDEIFLNIPLLQYIYRITKDTIKALYELPRRSAFKKVVWVELGKGKRMLGLVTDELENGYLVFLPSTPNPTTGFLLMVSKDAAVETDIGVEDALRTLISGGLIDVLQKG